MYTRRSILGFRSTASNKRPALSCAAAKRAWTCRASFGYRKSTASAPPTALVPRGRRTRSLPPPRFRLLPSETRATHAGVL